MAKYKRNTSEFSLFRLVNSIAAFVGYTLIFKALVNGNLTEELSKQFTALEGIFLMLYYKLFC